MSNATIAQALEDFFRSPRGDRFNVVRSQVTESDTYDPAAGAVVALEKQLAAGANVSEKDLSALAAEFGICPRFHYLCGRVAENMADQAGMQEAIQRMKVCLGAISESGDGTSRDPYQVTFLTDPDDLVRAFGEAVRHQQLVATPEGYRDVLTSHSGHEFWFDIELLLEKTSARAIAEYSSA